jgi:photosystem II stability/assembly factor-like uncharacterized protein
MAKAQLQAANSGSPASPNVADGIFNMPARDKQAAGAVARADASSNPRSSAEMAMSARSDQPKSVALDAANEGGVAIRSPSGKIMWRVGRGGKIQSSADAGRTWRLQKSPSQQDWIAGTATSDAACWLVGRKGAIARTTDGNTWIQIASPQAAAGGVNKLPDWTGVAATSAQAATIISSENQSYSTQDGGRTWVLE